MFCYRKRRAHRAISDSKHERADWTEVQELSQTERGEGGFGSTGVAFLLIQLGK
jgi:hypothetical protein